MTSRGVYTLKSIRVLRGLTQVQAAEKLGVTEDTLSNWERGKCYPTVPHIRMIEKVYGVTYDQLLFLPLDYDKTVNIL